MSYDGLDEIERRIFLDVACFLKGYNKERTIEVLESYGFCPCITVDVLVEKSLLTISDNHVWMHDLIQEMGREIVRQESYEEPGRRSRLWHRDDILNVFSKNRGTKAIEGIVLHLPELEEAHWNPEAFSKMSKLRAVNGFRLVENDEGCNNIAFLMLQKFCQGVRHSVLKFNFVIPGSEIPDWFSNQRVGDSLMVEWPPHLCNSKWMGFVLCAVFGAQENPAALLEFDSFGRHPCGILCYLEIAGSYQLSFPIPDEVCHSVGHVASDHLWLLYFSRKYHRCENFLKDNCSQVEVLFKPFCSVRNNTCLKLKKCGIHLVYGEDVEELNR